MGAVVAVLFFYLILPFFLYFFTKVFIVVLSILTGDKESLRNYGNLCEKDTYYPPQQYKNFRYFDDLH